MPSAEAFHGNCGSTISPVEFGPTSSPAGAPIRFYAKFIDSPDHCGIDGWHIGIDGANCYDCGSARIEGDFYVIENEVGWVSDGPHVITAVVREKCGAGCSCFGTPCTHGTVTWTLFVARDCGAVPPTPRDTSPIGNTETQTVTLQVLFDDNDRPCALDRAEMTLDGITVTPSITTWETPSGLTHRLSYDVPFALSQGSHVATARITERCCVTGGQAPNTASTQWAFHVNLCGTAPFVTASTTPSPGSVTSEPQPLISARFHDPEKPCDLSAWTFSVDGIDRPASFTHTGSDYLLTWRPDVPLAPGPHFVVATVTESNSGNKGTASWTFYSYAAPGEPIVFERTVIGTRGGGGTPDSVGIDRDCYSPFSICVGPFSAPVPFNVTYELDIEPSELGVNLDSARTEYFGPYDLTIPTPFGPFPFTVCGDPGGEPECELPVPADGGPVYHGHVRIVLGINGQIHTFDQPIII